MDIGIHIGAKKNSVLSQTQIFCSETTETPAFCFEMHFKCMDSGQLETDRSSNISSVDYLLTF